MNSSMQPFEFLGEPPSTEKIHQSSNKSLPDTSYAAFPLEGEGLHVSPGPSDSNGKNKELVQGIYIGMFAILGTLVRMLVAQVFGEYCKNPDSIGWLKASAPLCVTQGGTTEQGGIIFADLPANLLGSFIMGFFQNGATLGLALPLAIAWLTPGDPLQSMPILHKAITTGFCGSLTTFSGWNSAMVVLLFGTGQNRPTHVFNAMFGYIIGMETAVGSFMAGKSLALKLHQLVNPALAAEAEAKKQRAEEGVYMNPNLPDFERRYLPNLQMGAGEKDYGEMLPLGRLDALESWRASTKEARRVRHPQLELLNRIETAVLVEGLLVPPDTVSLAKANGWDLSGLEDWAASNRNRLDHLPSLSISSSQLSPEIAEPRMFQPIVAAAIFGLVMTLLLVLLICLNAQHSYTITNRTMVYSMLFAPWGALLRWKLSSLNGTLTTKGWQWYPFGTFLANFIGSIISILAIGGEYDMDSAYDVSLFWGVGTIRAVKVGFAGSLTTVSTFVAESTGFMNKTDHAYPYMFTTIGACCAVASLCYGTLLLVRSDGGDEY